MRLRTNERGNIIFYEYSRLTKKTDEAEAA